MHNEETKTVQRIKAEEQSVRSFLMNVRRRRMIKKSDRERHVLHGDICLASASYLAVGGKLPHVTRIWGP